MRIFKLEEKKSDEGFRTGVSIAEGDLSKSISASPICPCPYWTYLSTWAHYV